MASYDAFIKQLTNPRYLRRDLRVADIKGPRVPKVGVPRVTYKDGDIVGIDPMSTISTNENIVPGGALPLAGAITATQLPELVDKIDPNVLNKMMWTPAGIVLAPERKEEAKPKIETLPISEKQKTSTVTEIPEQTKTDIGFIPPVTDTEIPGLKPDTGEDTSILYSKRMDKEKLKAVENAHNELKKDLKRIPFSNEVADKLNIETYTARQYLKYLNLPIGGSFNKNLNEIGDVDVPTFSTTGNKWPTKEDKSFYENQIIERLKYPINSAEAKAKRDSGELLSNEELAKKYNISVSAIEKINKKIMDDYDLKNNRPIIGRPEALKAHYEKRKSATEIFSVPAWEKKMSGNYKAHLGHLSDLYNRTVYAETIGYTPAEINEALGKNLDSILKSINKKQDKLIKEKPPKWKETLENYNVKGINYAALSKGYKTFEPTDPETLKKYKYNIDYGKTIDPTGIYEGKTIEQVASETNLRNLNSIEKAFTQAVNKEKIDNPELITEENFKKLKDNKLFEINRKAVLKTQSNLKKEEKRKIAEYLLNIKKPKYSVGGRVGLKQGGEPTGIYYQEIPDVDPEIILHKQIMNEDDPVRVAALEHRLDMYRKQVAQEEKQRQEYKQAQKEQGVRYLEDFPTQSDYFKEMGKELASATGMPYLAAKFTKGVIELPEWVVGQTYTTGKALAGQGEHKFYHPVAGEKIGLDKAIQQLQPEKPTTGILNLGTAAELAGGFTDPLLLPKLGMKATGGIKSLVTPETKSLFREAVELTPETIDPTRRDLVKMMGVGAAAAALEPVLSKFSKLKTPPKVAEAIETGAKVLPKVSGMPEWFPTLVSKIQKEGKLPTKDYATADNVKIKELTIPSKTGKGADEVFVMTEYPDGKIEIHAGIKGGAYDEPFELHYTPPETFVDEATGKVIKEPGDFSVVEQRPRPVGGPEDADFEFDWEMVSKDQALSDIEKIEQITTGKITDPKLAEKRAAQRRQYHDTPYDDITDRFGDGEIDYDRMKDAGLLDD